MRFIIIIINYNTVNTNNIANNTNNANNTVNTDNTNNIINTCNTNTNNNNYYCYYFLYYYYYYYLKSFLISDQYKHFIFVQKCTVMSCVVIVITSIAINDKYKINSCDFHIQSHSIIFVIGVIPDRVNTRYSLLC